MRNVRSLRHRHRLCNVDAGHRSGLCAKPPAMLQVSRQQAFELLAGVAAQNAIEARIQLYLRNFVFREVCCSSRLWRVDRKPEEAVRSEREKIAQVTDSWKWCAPEQLNGRRALEFREIEFDVLH